MSILKKHLRSLISLISFCGNYFRFVCNENIHKQAQAVMFNHGVYSSRFFVTKIKTRVGVQWNKIALSLIN